MQVKKHRLNLDWMIQNITVPLEVTECLQKVADKHNYTADQMHDHKIEIIQQLQLVGKGYIVKYLFPDGLEDDERWLHSLLRMEIRRLRKLEKG
jgi:hypothetical protein